MPGECHAHLFMNGEDYKRAVEEHKNGVCESLVRKYLKSYQDQKITFIRDGGDRFGVSALAKELAPEYGIDYRTPVFAICRKGHYGRIVGKAVESLKEYQEAVREVKAQNGDFIKIMVSGIMEYSAFGLLSEQPLEKEWIYEMIRIAHEEGLSVMVHGNGRDAVLSAVLAGADSIEHGNYIDRECMDAMAETGCVWVPTIVTTKNLIGCGRYHDQVLEQIYAMECENLKYGYEHDVVLALGSDAGAYCVRHADGIYQEEKIFLECLSEENAAVQDVRNKLQYGERVIREKFRR